MTLSTLITLYFVIGFIWSIFATYMHYRNFKFDNILMAWIVNILTWPAAMVMAIRLLFKK
jgi:hypothetical protein